MFRKLAIIFCLISFVPAAVGAQGLTVAMAPQEASNPATDLAQAPVQKINLSLPAARSSAMLLAAAETTQGTSVEKCPEQKQEARSAHSWDNFVDVHFGGYRWIWWAGAAAILIAIHASAAN